MTQNQRSLTRLLGDYSKLTPTQKKSELGIQMQEVIKITNTQVIDEYHGKKQRNKRIGTRKQYAELPKVEREGLKGRMLKQQIKEINNSNSGGTPIMM